MRVGKRRQKANGREEMKEIRAAWRRGKNGLI